MRTKTKLKVKKPKPIPDVTFSVTIEVSAQGVFELARMLPIFDAMNGQTNEEAASFDYKRAIINRVLVAAGRTEAFASWMVTKVQRAREEQKSARRRPS